MGITNTHDESPALLSQITLILANFYFRNGIQQITKHHLQSRWVSTLQDACGSPRGRSESQDHMGKI